MLGFFQEQGVFFENEGEWSWFSIDWFQWNTLNSFQWENKNLLYIIPFIPLLFILKWLIQNRFQLKLEVAFKKGFLKRSRVYLLAIIPQLIFCLFLALVVISLARPQRTNEKVEQWSEGIDIMLVVDISESMNIEDFKPNRLAAAKEVAKKFISGRLHDRIGLVVFSGDAYSLAPLTSDYELLNTLIKDIKFSLIEKGGTAIGSALAVGTNRMRESKSNSKVLILLSDGENTAGNIDPITAANLANAYGIKIYTILIGREGLVPMGKDFFGNTNYVENSVDETTMRKIADIGEGRFFRAGNQSALEEIFSLIDKYEKAEIKESRYKDTKDYYQVYIKWALLLFLIWFLLKNSFINNFLED